MGVADPKGMIPFVLLLCVLAVAVFALLAIVVSARRQLVRHRTRRAKITARQLVAREPIVPVQDLTGVIALLEQSAPFARTESRH